MYYTNRSDGTVTKLISFLLERLIPLLAWLSVLVSFLLQYLIKRYMGLHRDLVHRNRILLTTVLTPTQMYLVK
ncbi:hypothetical protein [Alkaliphilus hydrothermalis]|uniref:BlaR1 peptidase M56 n=1 Tax=Alkaliphilus hydrothermalis TaxID=1482730 RepID=A0ABS2NSV2_9FIRM|nr:hypothetical protein [Alkaliphilus hydrothermalis]MBM7616040.1 hypothetical protein [Alkaliphilus hydrothermalis]